MTSLGIYKILVLFGDDKPTLEIYTTREQAAKYAELYFNIAHVTIYHEGEVIYRHEKQNRTRKAQTLEPKYG